MTKVLVIEQGGDLRAGVVNAIAEALTVESVGSAAAAIELQESARFDVIVWDLGCESESRGKILETLNKLSDHAGTSQIILVGGSTETEEITADPHQRDRA